MDDPLRLPSFADLPAVEGMPQGTAWGIFDKNGKKDVLGCLNLLTPSVVQKAAQEVSRGVSISLNLPLDALQFGFRKNLKHHVINWADFPPPYGGFQSWDDEVEFNTQNVSQWDSLLHYAHQETGLCYNGVESSTLGPELSRDSVAYDQEGVIPSLDKWQKRGGIVARGVLLDYKAWADAHAIEVNVVSRNEIKISDLEAIAAWEGVKLQQGDVLIVRSGFVEPFMDLSPQDQAKLLATATGMIGVTGTEESAAWFWNHHFAAVAGDMIAFEVLPPAQTADRTDTGSNLGRNSCLSRWLLLISVTVLHQYFLSLFGMSIGELWDLRRLSAYCAEIGKYSFLLTSIPLHVPGGVGSPPNAIAIF